MGAEPSRHRDAARGQAAHGRRVRALSQSAGHMHSQAARAPSGSNCTRRARCPPPSRPSRYPCIAAKLAGPSPAARHLLALHALIHHPLPLAACSYLNEEEVEQFMIRQLQDPAHEAHADFKRKTRQARAAPGPSGLQCGGTCGSCHACCWVPLRGRRWGRLLRKGRPAQSRQPLLSSLYVQVARLPTDQLVGALNEHVSWQRWRAALEPGSSRPLCPLLPHSRLRTAHRMQGHTLYPGTLAAHPAGCRLPCPHHAADGAAARQRCISQPGLGQGAAPLRAGKGSG